MIYSSHDSLLYSYPDIASTTIVIHNRIRICPTGMEETSKGAGLTFYDKVFNEPNRYGIELLVTIPLYEIPVLCWKPAAVGMRCMCILSTRYFLLITYNFDFIIDSSPK